MPEAPARESREWRFYLGDTLWSIIRDDIPKLLPALQSLRDNNR